jgi:hypothetical protein
MFGVPAFLMYKYGVTEGMMRSFAFVYYFGFAGVIFGLICATLTALSLQIKATIGTLLCTFGLVLIGLGGGSVANGTSYYHFDLLYFNEITGFLSSIL